MKKRLDYLDALRGFAVLMVLMVHTAELNMTANLPATLLNLIEAGKFGVQLFFLISAFTIFYTLHKGDKNTRNFLIRRFFRIAPLYYLAVCYYSWQNQSFGTGAILNLFFLHGFSIPYINGVVPGGWSVGVEMLFYLMVPLLFVYVNSLKRSIYFLIAAIIFSFFVLYIEKYIGMDRSIDGASFIYFWLPNQLPVFAIGFVLFFLITTPWATVDKEGIAKACFPLILIVLAYFMTGLPLFRTHIFASVAFAGLICYLSLRNNRFFVNPFSLFLGKISYSIYLSQFAVLQMMMKYNLYRSHADSTLGNEWNFVINYLILSVLTIAVSYFLYQFIEKPFQKMGRWLIRKISKVPDVVRTLQEKVVYEKIS